MLDDLPVTSSDEEERERILCTLGCKGILRVQCGLNLRKGDLEPYGCSEGATIPEVIGVKLEQGQNNTLYNKVGGAGDHEYTAGWSYIYEQRGDAIVLVISNRNGILQAEVRYELQA